MTRKMTLVTAMIAALSMTTPSLGATEGNDFNPRDSIKDRAAKILKLGDNAIPGSNFPLEKILVESAKDNEGKTKYSLKVRPYNPSESANVSCSPTYDNGRYHINLCLEKGAKLPDEYSFITIIRVDPRNQPGSDPIDDVVNRHPITMFFRDSNANFLDKGDVAWAFLESDGYDVPRTELAVSFHGKATTDMKFYSCSEMGGMIAKSSTIGDFKTSLFITGLTVVGGRGKYDSIIRSPEDSKDTRDNLTKIENFVRNQLRDQLESNFFANPANHFTNYANACASGNTSSGNQAAPSYKRQ